LASRLPILTLSLLFLIKPAFAADEDKAKVKLSDEKSKAEEPADTELIDAPTANVYDYGALATRGRFTSKGGLLSDLTIGVVQRFTIGASMMVDRLIGTTSPAKVRAPTVQLKYRFYDGSRLVPALAVGFDGQGYFYNDTTHKFNETNRGLYFVGSQEVGVPGLWLHPGINISDFDTNALAGFIGLSWTYKNKLSIMTEWDNIHDISNSRWNIGARFYITPEFQITGAVREIGGGTFADGTDHSAERVVLLKYVGNF
jgi:hypothetical protein